MTDQVREKMMNVLKSEVRPECFAAFKKIFIMFLKRNGYSAEFAAEEFPFLVALSNGKSVAEFEKAYALANRFGMLSIPSGRAGRRRIALSFENALNHAFFEYEV